MIHNHEVPGSIPGPATKKIRELRSSWLSYFFLGETKVKRKIHITLVFAAKLSNNSNIAKY